MPLTARAALRRIAALSVLLFGIGCRPAGKPVETDLVALFRFTDTAQDTTEIDLGSTQAAPFLGPGWSAPEITSAGDSVARAVQRTAAVKVTVLEPADRMLAVRCAATHLPRTRPAAVIVRLNGRRVGQFSPGSAMEEHRIALPGTVQRRGDNDIVFAMRLGRGEERFDVAFDALHVFDDSTAPRAAPRADGDALLMPPATEARYFLRLPSRPALHFGVDADGPPVRLTIRALRDGEAERTVFTGGETTASADVALDDFAGAITRLTVRNDGPVPLRLQRPRLRGVDLLREPRRQIAPRPGSNVIVYVIDTLRADHLGCYGYARPTSPQIDAFARQSVLFANTIAQSSWTRPSTASMLTGQYPNAHGAITLRSGISPNAGTLAERLREHGYRTAAFVTNVNVAPQWGFQRGFDLYRYLAEDERSAAVHVGSDVLNAQAVDWLDARGERPFFLYLHASDPHAPYRPPSPWAERLADPTADVPAERVDALLGAIRARGEQPTDAEVRALRARYDGEIAFTDDNFGHFLAALRQRGLDDRTLVLLVADHGEEFADHGGFEHGRTLYDEMIRVPLLVRFPDGGAAGTRVAGVARQIDILPTVLDYLALPVPAGLPGRSLLSSLDAGDAGSGRPIDALAATSLGRQSVAAVVTGEWKVIETKTTGTATTVVFNVAVDGQERDDRAARQPVLLGYARQALAAAAVGAGVPADARAAEPVVDPAIMERLRALGYSE